MPRTRPWQRPPGLLLLQERRHFEGGGGVLGQARGSTWGPLVQRQGGHRLRQGKAATGTGAQSA